MDKEGVSVINSGGKGQINRLYRLFNEFKIPCYIIFDIDKSNQEVRKLSEELLDLMGWSDKDVRSTVITEKFAAFEEKFEETMKNEIPDYASLEKDAKEFLGITKESKPLIARRIARKLVEKGENEGDSKKYVPPTIKQIIERIKEIT